MEERICICRAECVGEITKYSVSSVMEVPATLVSVHYERSDVPQSPRPRHERLHIVLVQIPNNLPLNESTRGTIRNVNFPLLCHLRNAMRDLVVRESVSRDVLSFEHDTSSQGVNFEHTIGISVN